MSTSQGQYPGESESSTTQSSARRDFNQGVQQSPAPMAMSVEAAPRPLLPPFSSRPYSHLPTPQSPTNLRQYNGGIYNSPDSPITHGPNSFAAPAHRPPLPSESLTRVDLQLPPLGMQHSFMTPESSPMTSRVPIAKSDSVANRTDPPARLNFPMSQTPTTASASSPHSHMTSSRSATPTNHIPLSAPDAHSRTGLSSPFMAKLNVGDRLGSSRTPQRTPRQTPATSPPMSPRSRPMHAEDVFSGPSQTKTSFQISTVSTPSVSPRPLGTPPPLAGGEIDRIRQDILHDRLAQYHEAESRRPDYLKRQKRTLSDTDPIAHPEEERPVGVGVGIMESPHKGRRLKLFQETSDESFEESLMAGGYGRYRTADWVRQPQPLLTPIQAGPSTIAQALEQEVVAPSVPTEKDLLKQRRLSAFRSEPAPKAKLRAVEIEGKGRVLLEVDAEELRPPVPEATSPKKRGAANRRKKKGETDVPVLDRRGGSFSGSRDAELVEQPNWPDEEFPWRLRTEERVEMKRAEEEERMKWIEKFLDRDSDDEGQDDDAPLPPSHEELLSPPWGMDSIDARPPARGRGKYVPLHVDRPEENGTSSRSIQRKTAFFPTDPADARAALLAKKSVRTLSYRQQKRAKGSSKARRGKEEVCICRGYDDGRELVQCDGCQTWYHLQCIGIKSIAELGREEDPWYCNSCMMERASEASDDLNMVDLLSMEPTFVQNEEEPRMNRSYDTPFFTAPGIEDSPVPSWSRIPKTPTRGSRANGGSMDLSSSGSSWIDSSRPGPSTPYQSSQAPHVYANTTPGGPFDMSYSYEDSFDPTSTPSRGMKIAASFATPKTTLWPTRPQNMFHTPSRATGGVRDVTALARAYEGTGPAEPTQVASGGSYSPYPYPRIPTCDDSPIRRDAPPDRMRGQGARRILESPLTNALTAPSSVRQPNMDGSPIMRAKGKERSHDHGAPLQRLTR
ncbi:hypothetical protein HGRIS_007374 [Hohenbuehelia grisea]|uniref:PHD-type domain-containing protein n=1 Tax=Hohenbuehelia grisea TaxID=104357 RepID=A0ABR3J5C5_9AGAR